MRRIAGPSLIGNVLEWYDFALYGYFAPVISPLFFPADNPFLSLITTFAVFAIGFLMRPLGAAIFGYYGDRYGRKNALAAAILLMAIPTTLIGCLPTHQQIGISAGLLLTLFRLLQGLAVGGEFTGSIVYIIEHAAANRRGFYGSLAMASAFTGLVLGSGVAALVGFVAGDTDYETWVWRIPFLLSILLGAVGLYLRIGMPESPVFEAMKERQQLSKAPVTETFKKHYRKMFSSIILVGLPSMGFYLSFVYLTTFMTVYLKVDLDYALLINTLSMMMIMLIIPLFGLLSDKLGRKAVMRMGAIGFICLSLPAYYLLIRGDYFSIFAAQLIFALLVSMSYSAIPAFLVERFPASVRYTGISIPYNLANAIFGGTAPLVATSLIHYSKNFYSPAFYLMTLGAVVFFMLLRITHHTEKF